MDLRELRYIKLQVARQLLKLRGITVSINDQSESLTTISKMPNLIYEYFADVLGISQTNKEKNMCSEPVKSYEDIYVICWRQEEKDEDGDIDEVDKFIVLDSYSYGLLRPIKDYAEAEKWVEHNLSYVSSPIYISKCVKRVSTKPREV